MQAWFWQFLLYSFLGYLLEKGFAALSGSPRQTRKCFLLLPLCPVYGLGVLAVLALPEDYKLPVYLFYYEGYPTAEIARMLDVAPATVRSRLNRARKKLKLTLGGDTYDG